MSAEKDLAATTTQAVTYQLLIELRRPIYLEIGRLGKHTLAAGCYLYTGSARRNLEARIARHLRHDKKVHWHIDHLLSRNEAQVVAVHRFIEPECQINQASPGSLPIPGFGASDCEQGCGSHLRYLGPSIPNAPRFPD